MNIKNFELSTYSWVFIDLINTHIQDTTTEKHPNDSLCTEMLFSLLPQSDTFSVA